jgi:hypothetical protein
METFGSGIKKFRIPGWKKLGFRDGKNLDPGWKNFGSGMVEGACSCLDGEIAGEVLLCGRLDARLVQLARLLAVPSATRHHQCVRLAISLERLTPELKDTSSNPLRAFSLFPLQNEGTPGRLAVQYDVV